MLAVFTRPGAVRLLVATCVAGLLHACSGAVSSNTPVSSTTPITVTPSSATLYSDLPATFLITGGNGNYIVASSDQLVVPIAGVTSGNSITVVPSDVGADTNVTLTVRDTGTAAPASADIVVKPRTVTNTVTVTPSSTQGGSCAPAICSGGDAIVTATIAQNGVPLAGRNVRMEVVSGDFRFIVSPAGQPEVLGTSIDVVTDQAGKASARIRVLADASNQTALLRVTDLGSGGFRDTSFLLTQSTGGSPGFFVTPSTLEFTGASQGQCAGTDVSAAFFVIGGLPPYTVLSSGGTVFTVDTLNLFQSGDSVTVTPRGICTGGLPITVRDSAGHTASVTVSNVEGTIAVTPVVASPATVSLSTCAGASSVVLSGGTGTYGVATGSNTLITSLSGSNLTIKRRVPSFSPGTNSIIVAATDGRTSANITVNLSGEALGDCGSSTALTVSPGSVNLDSCTSQGVVTISGGGGSGTYTATPSDSALTTTISGHQLVISRTHPSPAFSGSATVTVSSGSFTPQSVTVNTSGTGAGACP